MRRVPSFAAIALLLVAACGPESSPGPESPPSCACTEFRAVQFLVVNRVAAPIPVVAVVVTLQRTGEVLPVTQPGLHAGVVTVVDDSLRARIRPEGESIRCAVTLRSSSLDVDTVVGIDQPCACHVERLSGPGLVMSQ
jgi:hypothetical protein